MFLLPSCRKLVWKQRLKVAEMMREIEKYTSLVVWMDPKQKQHWLIEGRMGSCIYTDIPKPTCL